MTAGYRGRVSFRPAVAAVALLFALGGLSACTPEPEPTETAPAFASEEEAFAAAEETYRAYVDAVNRVDLSDPATFEDVYAWTAGELNTQERQTYSAWHAEGFAIDGSASIDRLVRQQAELNEGQVVLGVCYDVTSVDVLDRDGASIVDSDRADVQKLRVTLATTTSTATGLVITGVGAEDELTC